MLRVVPAHTCTERCIHMSYQFCLSLYIANFSFLTFNLSDHCFLVSKCLMRTQLATLFIILVCEKVLLSPHPQSSFGLQQLGSRSQCGSLSSSSLEFVELGALYLGGFFPLSNFGCVQAFIFFQMSFLPLSSYVPWFSVVYAALLDGWRSRFSISPSPIQTLISCLWGEYNVFKCAEFPVYQVLFGS